MCKSALHDFLRHLPKCEHHVHIEGTLMPSLLFKLASRNSVALPKEDPAYASENNLLERYNSFTSLDDFLNYYYIGISVLVRQEDFEDLAWAYFEKAHSDGVAHSEIFFDPQAHTARGITFSTLLDGLTAAKRRAQQQLGMSVELISCFLRHLPAQSAIDMYQSTEFQAATAAGLITAIGLDSSENGFPPSLFTELYGHAQTHGLRRTAHAGEEGPAENVGACISSLGCQRIDHGIRLAEDPELMSLVAQRGIMLTVCPLSNVRLRCVSNIAQLPIRRFLDAGVKFSLNSDDPAYFGGFVLDNYCAVQEAFDLTAEEWKGICMASIEGSWCTTDRKQELRQLLASTTTKFE